MAILFIFFFWRQFLWQRLKTDYLKELPFIISFLYKFYSKKWKINIAKVENQLEQQEREGEKIKTQRGSAVGRRVSVRAAAGARVSFR